MISCFCQVNMLLPRHGLSLRASSTQIGNCQIATEFLALRYTHSVRNRFLKRRIRMLVIEIRNEESSTPSSVLLSLSRLFLLDILSSPPWFFTVSQLHHYLTHF